MIFASQIQTMKSLRLLTYTTTLLTTATTTTSAFLPLLAASFAHTMTATTAATFSTTARTAARTALEESSATGAFMRVESAYRNWISKGKSKLTTHTSTVASSGRIRKENSRLSLFFRNAW
jgi:hypothetical protein